MRRPRVTHVAIVHQPLDTRIFRKQCLTLAAAGWDVHLVVPGPPAGQVEGVRLHSVAAEAERPAARRQPARQWRAARWAWRLRPSVFHVHEPHLIPLGLALRLAGARVVYDVHEDNQAKPRAKLRDRPVRARLKALMWTVLEGLARRSFDRFVCASPALAERFPAPRTEVVGNLPQHRDFALDRSPPHRQRGTPLVYTGLIWAIRGFHEIAAALELVPDDLDCRLRLIGTFRPPQLEEEARALPAWRRMEFVPWQPYPVVVEELLNARAGLVLLHPLPNHNDPIRSRKLFEYMAAGVPVIASDMPRWREIVCGVGCGLVVDPCDPAAIAAAIERLLRDPVEAEDMGRRGRAAVETTFNWDPEAARLLALYRELGGQPVALRTPRPAVQRAAP